MRLQSTTAFPCQAWTVTLFSLPICLGGLAQIAVCVWLIIFTVDIVPIIGEPMRNVFIGYIILGSFASLTSTSGSCCALMRNKTGLILYGGFLAASIVCQAGLWTFIYLEQREVTALDGLQARMIENSDTTGQVLNVKFHCRLERHSNEVEELEICGRGIAEWLSTVSTVLWSLSAALICIQFLVLVMVAMLRQLVSLALNRNKVVDFCDAEVIDHSRRTRLTNQECLGHIECNCDCHTSHEQDVHQTTISL